MIAFFFFGLLIVFVFVVFVVVVPLVFVVVLFLPVVVFFPRGEEEDELSQFFTWMLSVLLPSSLPA